MSGFLNENSGGGGGTIGGTATQPQVAYGSGPNTLTSDAGFYRNGGTSTSFGVNASDPSGQETNIQLGSINGHLYYVDVAGNQYGVSVSVHGTRVHYNGNNIGYLPIADGISGQFMATDGSGNWSFQNIPQLPLNVVTGTGTVDLNDNSYNVISPGSAQPALTMNLPANPSDGDVVEIKFAYVISSPTIATTDGSTVNSQIISPNIGYLTKYTYQASGTTWY